MRAAKLLICNLAIASSLLVSGIVQAETCYDPDYNEYFTCGGSGYYYGNYGTNSYSNYGTNSYSSYEENNNAIAAFAFGAIVGAAAGYGAGGGYNNGEHHHRHHGGGHNGGGYHNH
jgi:hypothetical protein